MHCSIEYCSDRQRYMVKDHASQAGTFVNNKRLSKVRSFSLVSFSSLTLLVVRQVQYRTSVALLQQSTNVFHCGPGLTGSN